MPKIAVLTAAGIAATLFMLSAAARAQAPAAQRATAPARPAALLVPLEQIKLLALSQADGRAVLAMPDQQMVVVKNGDAVPRTRARLVEVLQDKLILEESGLTADVPEQRVWMHKGKGGGPARLERFSSFQAPALTSSPPMRQVVTVPAAAAGAGSARARQP